MGRPSLIDAPIREADDGTLISVSEAIVNAMRAGSYFERACRANGVAKGTAYGWLELAGRLRLRAHGRPFTELDPPATEHELRCVAFSDAVDDADAQWELGLLATAQHLLRGGIETRKTVTKMDADRNVTEIVETVEVLPPNAQVLLWRLERRFPDRYGRRVEITGKDGGPVELSTAERANALADSLVEHQERTKATARNSRPRAPRKSHKVESEP